MSIEETCPHLAPIQITLDLLDGDLTLRHTECGLPVAADWTGLRAHQLPLTLVYARDDADEDWLELGLPAGLDEWLSAEQPQDAQPERDNPAPGLWWSFTGGADTCYLNHDDNGSYRECCMRAGLAYVLKLYEQQIRASVATEQDGDVRAVAPVVWLTLDDEGNFGVWRDPDNARPQGGDVQAARAWLADLSENIRSYHQSIPGQPGCTCGRSLACGNDVPDYAAIWTLEAALDAWAPTERAEQPQDERCPECGAGGVLWRPDDRECEICVALADVPDAIDDLAEKVEQRQADPDIRHLTQKTLLITEHVRDLARQNAESRKPQDAQPERDGDVRAVAATLAWIRAEIAPERKLLGAIQPGAWIELEDRFMDRIAELDAREAPQR